MDGRLPERQQPPREQPESDCFFVQAAQQLLLSFGDNASASTDRNNSSGTINLWHEGYTLDRSKVPEGILEEDCIDTVFLIGKGGQLHSTLSGRSQLVFALAVSFIIRRGGGSRIVFLHFTHGSVVTAAASRQTGFLVRREGSSSISDG